MAVTENDLIVGPLVLASGVDTISLDFYFEKKDWLSVYKSGSETPLVLDTDYTVAGEGTVSGVVTLTTPANGTDAYSVYLHIPLERISDMQLRGEFRSDPFNKELDRVWQAMQGNATASARSLRVASASPQLPPITYNAGEMNGRTFIVNDDGSSIVPGPDAGEIADAQGYATAATDAATAAAASAAQAALYDGPVFDTVPAVRSDTSMTYTAGQPGTVTAGDRVVINDGALSMEVLASGTTGTLSNAASPAVHLKPSPNSIGDIRMFGGYEGDAAANRAALLSARDYYTTGGTIYFPVGQWSVAGGGDIAFTADDLAIVGAGPETHIEVDGCSILFDAVAKGAHLWRGGIRDLNISRIGTAGPVVHLNGKPLMGVSRFGLVNVHVLGSSSKAGDGIIAQGAWSSSWIGGSVSGCANGFHGKLDVDGASSANAWYLYGLEIQGNAVGIRLDSAVVVDIVATIEGNDGHGMVLENNCRQIRANLYCEGNGSAASDRDILVGDTGYSGTKNTGYGCVFGGFYADAGKGKDCAIELTRQNIFKVQDAAVFNGYTQGGVMVNPEGGAVARVDGKVGTTSLVAGTPETIIDNTGARYTGSEVKPDAASAIQTFSLVFDPPSAASGATATLAVTATGVKSGDHITAASSSVNRLGCEVFFRCTADDEITMYVSNASASAKDIGAATWTLVVMDQRFAA